MRSLLRTTASWRLRLLRLRAPPKKADKQEDLKDCDAPARAFVKCIKPHTAYNSCERCTQRGEWCDKIKPGKPFSTIGKAVDQQKTSTRSWVQWESLTIVLLEVVFRDTFRPWELCHFMLFFARSSRPSFFADKCRNGSGVLHINCTGTVVKRMPEQKVPYYYAMVMQDHSMPVCEFLTTCHWHAWLMSVMDHFLSDVVTVNAGRWSFPKTVVVDFSFRLLRAVLLAFNRCSVTSYLNISWAVVQQNQAKPKTTVKLCCAHFIKAVAHRMCRNEQRKGPRQAALVMLGLQECNSLDRATELYTAAYRILCTEKDTSSVTEAKHASLYGDKFDEISAQMSDVMTVWGTRPRWNECEHSTKLTICCFLQTCYQFRERPYWLRQR